MRIVTDNCIQTRIKTTTIMKKENIYDLPNSNISCKNFLRSDDMDKMLKEACNEKKPKRHC